MNKQEKIDLVKSLGSTLKEASSVVLVNFAGLSVSSQQALKKQLKEVDADMVVVKNTLIKLAAKDANLDEKTVSDEVLTGQTALVVSKNDPIAAIQVLGKFIKENNVPEFKVGIVEGSFQDAQGLSKLSTLPGKDALLGQVLGSLMSPSYGLVGVLQGNLQKLVYIIDQKSKQKVGD